MAEEETENNWSHCLFLQMGNRGPERRKDLPQIVTRGLALWFLFTYFPPEPVSATTMVLAGFILMPRK